MIKRISIAVSSLALTAAILLAGTPIANLVLTGNMDAGGNKVTNLGTPTASTDAATKGYVDNGLSDKVSLSGSYNNPAWITALAWSKLSGTPTVVANFASLTTAANKGLYFTAVDSPATYDLTAAGRALLDDATPADQRATLGLGDSATKSVGTTAGTVAAGDDSRITGAAQTSATYSNPAWITALAWSKISGAPAFLIANQTITLTGAVTGSGTTSITTTLSANQARDNLTGGTGTLNLSGFTVTLPTVPIAQGGTGATTPAGAFANLKQPASTSATGVVQIATDIEVQGMADSLKAVVSSSLGAWWTWIKTQAQTVAGNWIFSGNLTAGDAVGDSLTVNAGTVTAPNATAVGPTNISNVAALDGRYGKDFFAVSQGSNLSISSNTTLADTALVSPTLAAGNYIIDVTLYGESLTSTVPGWKYRLNFTGAAGGRVVGIFPTAANGGSPNFTGLTINTTTTVSGAASNFFYFTARGTLSVSTSGVFSVQLAQNTSSADAIILSSISALSIKKF